MSLPSRASASCAGKTRLLDDISWEVEEGERWVILGPNGAGKTTLLQMAAARMHPTTGTVGILGDKLGAIDVFEVRPRVGLASAAMAERIPDGEIVGNVVVTAAYGIVGRWNEHYDTAGLRAGHGVAAALGAEHLADRRYGTLSEGERKRVQIARALMTDPELMLLDEPAAGLDLGGREDLVARLGVLASDTEAPAWCWSPITSRRSRKGFTDALLLRDGRIVAAGPLEVTLTSENLSATFDLPWSSSGMGNRWSARRRPRHRGTRGGAPRYKERPQPVGTGSSPGARSVREDDGGRRGELRLADLDRRGPRPRGPRSATVDFTFLMLAGGALGGSATAAASVPPSRAGDRCGGAPSVLLWSWCGRRSPALPHPPNADADRSRRLRAANWHTSC
jgi:iron complex transport system ATP-binding protein